MIKLAAIKVNGKIYTGLRHSLIIPTVLKENPDVPYITQEMQGFVTDDGHFVDRVTAAELAFSCGQIKEQKKTLFSEDIL